MHPPRGGDFPSMEERLSTAAALAARRVLYPFWRTASGTILGLAFFGHLYNFIYRASSVTPQGWQAGMFFYTQRLSSQGFTLFALVVGFLSLVVLPFWEKIGTVAAMFCLAWLARLV